MFKAAAAPKDDDEAGGGYLNGWWVFVHNEKRGVFNGWKNSAAGGGENFDGALQVIVWEVLEAMLY